MSNASGDARVKRLNAGSKAQDQDAMDALKEQAKRKWFVVQFDDDDSWETFCAADPNWDEHYMNMVFKRVGDSCKRKYMEGIINCS